MKATLEGTVALVTGASSGTGAATATGLAEQNRPEILEGLRGRFVPRMEAEDIADAIRSIVTRPRQMAVDEMLIRPTEQGR